MSSSLNPKILILGSEGFTGKHFQDYIIHKKLYKRYSFFGIDKKKSLNPHIIKKTLNLSIPHKVEAELTSIRPQYLINFVGMIGTNNFPQLLEINDILPFRILDTILRKRIKVKKVLLISSAAEYGEISKHPATENDLCHPINPYGVSKKIQTDIASFFFKSYGIPIVIARTFNIIGKNISPNTAIGEIALKINKIQGKGILRTGDLSLIRDFLDINDVIDAYWKLLIFGQPGEIYNVCSEKKIMMRTLVNYLILNSGKNITLCEQKNNTKSNNRKSIGSNKKLKRITGWSIKNNIFDSLAQLISL